ncbi:9128_t:CDS:2 [Paraglomus occultum]|uniref:9128_t:CDS:1 n=1 Tax=Paraglomus occultum TaxID=144539 RepID=A0A9N8ZJZ8_9GLOM|nr:9128_t:CDS:2 [Paraglomus occultum]
MSLRQLVSGDADCGPANPASELLKRFDQDQSLTQDLVRREAVGEGSSNSAFRAHFHQASVTDHELANDFFLDATHQPPPQENAFQFNHMNKELSTIYQPIQEGSNAAWISEFLGRPNEKPNITAHDPIYDDFETAFRNAQGMSRFILIFLLKIRLICNPRRLAQNLLNTVTAFLGLILSLDRNWAEDFAQFTPQPTNIDPDEAAAFERAFEEAENCAVWQSEFQTQESSWASEFQEQESASGNANSELARTARMLMDTVSGETNPKFKNSVFFNFIKNLGDERLSIEGNKVVAQESPVSK